MKEKKKNKPIRLFVFATGHDERIPKEPPDMEVTLSKPIKPGFRRAFTVSTDEAIDNQRKADSLMRRTYVVGAPIPGEPERTSR